jgi:hypothetical protein
MLMRSMLEALLGTMHDVSVRILLDEWSYILSPSLKSCFFLLRSQIASAAFLAAAHLDVHPVLAGLVCSQTTTDWPSTDNIVPYCASHDCPSCMLA